MCASHYDGGSFVAPVKRGMWMLQCEKPIMARMEATSPAEIHRIVSVEEELKEEKSKDLYTHTQAVTETA